MMLNIYQNNFICDEMWEEYPYEYMDSFKKYSDEKFADIFGFFSSLKDECIMVYV